jgi:caffeoyl-CoA O-methyltransferase
MSPMIPDLESYFRQFVPARDALMRSLEQEAARDHIPIIGPVVGQLLYLLVRLTGARRILELGTATGYSTLFLARAARTVKGHVTTLEKDPIMAKRAVKTMQTAGFSDDVTVLEATVPEALLDMTPPFDLVFMDIDKPLYATALPECQRLLKSGGLVVADNVAFAEAAEFNDAINIDPAWENVHLLAFLPFHSPERDGLCLALRV